MGGLLLITTLLIANPSAINVGDALNEYDAGNYRRAALLLDEVARSEPVEYDSSDLHYLRGRIAETQRDWGRAQQEFNQVGADSLLYHSAVWRLARIAIVGDRPDDARDALRWLPSDFPDELMAELAELAPPALALEIYDRLGTRQARLALARMRNDRDALRALLRESVNDDVAVHAARALFSSTASASERLFLGETYAAHREFDLAESIYTSLLGDPEHAAEAHYRLGRVYFQLADYDRALGMYRATMLHFPDTDWAEDAELQLAPTYWRKLDFETAVQAYLDLIDRYGDDSRRYQSFVRDLVDVYRALGETDAALNWIELGLRNRPSGSDRAVLLFTQAKIHYLTGAWDEALAGFREVGRLDLRAVPNGTDIEEIRFFEGAALEKLERTEEAHQVWRRLAEEPFTYYGIQAARRLGESNSPGNELDAIIERTLHTPASDLCRRPAAGLSRELIRTRRLTGIGKLLEQGVAANRVAQLTVLNLWDEAFFWARQQAVRYDNETLAELAYLAGDYRRAMLYADRMRPPTEDLFNGTDTLQGEILAAMRYPAAFADLICEQAAAANVNPLWLRSIIWQESRYDPSARSGAIARGLMQFIPETALDVASQLGMTRLDVTVDLYDPAVSVKLGAHYWRILMDEFRMPEMALAAYNGGPQNVRRWLAKSGGDPSEIFVSDIGFVETKNYVRRIFELYARYAYLQLE